MESFLFIRCCKHLQAKALDVLLLDGGGRRAIILAVTNYVIKVIVK